MNKKLLVALIAIVTLATAGTAWAVMPFHFLANRIDFVNIGDPISEAGHNLAGWGVIEPATTGGNWGQIGNDVSGVDCDLAIGQNCDAASRVTYAKDEADNPTSRTAYVSFNNNERRIWNRAKVIKMRVLDGAADDDFVVFAKNRIGHWVSIYQYTADPATTEVWKVHTISLQHYPDIRTNKKLELRIMSTSSDWSAKSTYGQLAVDWIEVLGRNFVWPHLPICLPFDTCLY